MPEQSVIVWDLETVPDLAAAARMLARADELQRRHHDLIEPRAVAS